MAVGASKLMAADIRTASPYRLHQMVVDGALRFGYQAEKACQSEDWPEMDTSCDRARQFVGELISGMKNTDDAPEFIQDVQSLFVFAYRQLAEGQWERNTEKLHAAVQILELHRETWQELGASLHTPAATPATPGRLNRSA